MDHSRFQQLFRKLAEHTATTEEKDEIRRIISSHPDELFPYQQWQDTSSAGRLSTALRSGTLDKAIGVPVINMRKISSAHFLQQAIAAAAIILIAVGYYWIRHSTPSYDPIETMISTAFGEQKKITLPDGSLIHLNGGSRLELAEDFNKDHRKVKLEGEAYFDVTRSSGHPFTVQTGSLNTIVLGTAFNISSMPGNNISISVRSGKVRVDAGKQVEVLKEGMIAFWDSAASNMDIEWTPADNIGSWGSNRIVFRNASLEEICISLERRHGVHFRADTPGLMQCRYSTIFDKLTLQASLDKLALLGNLRYKQKDSTITITGSPCRP